MVLWSSPQERDLDFRHRPAAEYDSDSIHDQLIYCPAPPTPKPTTQKKSEGEAIRNLYCAQWVHIYCKYLPIHSSMA
jgi:hypothetical protein